MALITDTSSSAVRSFTRTGTAPKQVIVDLGHRGCTAHGVVCGGIQPALVVAGDGALGLMVLLLRPLFLALLSAILRVDPLQRLSPATVVAIPFNFVAGDVGSILHGRPFA